ncbi:MAG TPA: hypothetical protein VNQ77_04635 [Frankiaceae bacterium]|nr:hypothetical protein [Frankiaceae bacterium]
MPTAVDTPPTEQQQSTFLPPPLRAGLGLVAAGVEKAKHVHVTDIVTLPLRGIGALAQARETVERTYEELSNRGETILARWRGRPEPRQTADPLPTEEEMQAAVEEATNPFGLPEEVTTAIEDATPGATLSHDELPLADYDHLTLGSLRARLPKLDAVALVQLLDYERSHAHRLPVLTMLENRIAKIGNQV